MRRPRGGISLRHFWRPGVRRLARDVRFSARMRLGPNDAATIRSVLDGLVPVEQTVQAQSFDNQAEFVKPIWDYAKSAVSPTRIANGQAKLAANAAIFEAVEAAYADAARDRGGDLGHGVELWLAFIGTLTTRRACWRARRRSAGARISTRGELLAIMQLIEERIGDARPVPQGVIRRRAGADAVHALDACCSMAATSIKDGHKDHLDQCGRRAGVGGELPDGATGWRAGPAVGGRERAFRTCFDYSLGDGRKLTRCGVEGDVGLLPATAPEFANSDSLQAELFLPAGSYGPAFLLFDNFSVIKKYNNADSYALAVGLLADRLAGRPDLSRSWPTNIVMLTQQQAKDLQAALNKLNYSAGAIDGIIGRGTRGALQKFQKDKGLVADGFPTVAMLDAVLLAAKDA
jgi:membrane-bound lytic murein transglycosylase B